MLPGSVGKNEKDAENERRHLQHEHSRVRAEVLNVALSLKTDDIEYTG